MAMCGGFMGPEALRSQAELSDKQLRQSKLGKQTPVQPFAYMDHSASRHLLSSNTDIGKTRIMWDKLMLMGLPPWVGHTWPGLEFLGQHDV
jgi:hypothetical protein